MKTSEGLILFAVGVLVGSAATCTYFKNKYETIAKEEIESTEEVFQRKMEKVERVTNETVEKRAYEIVASRYDQHTKNEQEEEVPVESRPYVIRPDEFGENDYETQSLIYYDDHVLTYENDDVVEDVDGLVGKESLCRFGEYENDTVYVRNDKMKTDFEILADSQRYEDLYCN